MKTKIHRNLIFVLILLAGFVVSNIAQAASLNITTKYSITGGLKGELNEVGDKINGVDVCPVDPSPGCDFESDPGYNNNGTVDVVDDDFYTGDLIVRTNDAFEIIAAWSWSGDTDGTQKDITLVGTLPTGYKWTDIPGACLQSASSISADGLTITCVRSNIDDSNVGTVTEDLSFGVLVMGDVPNGAQPGDITFTATSSDGAGPVSDDTDGNSLTITASPRWNLQKGYYRVFSGVSFDDDNDPNTPDVEGYRIEYTFSIETDEVDGEIDDAYALLGNESMGDDATFTFTDDISDVSPSAQLVGCTMNGRFVYQDGYLGGGNVITYSGPGSLHQANPEQHIPQLKDEQQVTCNLNGTDINVTVSHVDATLKNYPTHNYNGNALPVNRAIAALGNIAIFVPLSDVENGDDGVAGTSDDGHLVPENRLRNFDPTTPTGNSNFGTNHESERDNDFSSFTLYGLRGSLYKYYRGEGGSVWTYPGGATSTRTGDGVVNVGYEFSTLMTSVNTGGTAFTEEMCDVIDAYRLEIQDIEDNQYYTNIQDRYNNYSHNDNSIPIKYYVSSGSGDYVNGAPGPYEFLYSGRYVDNSWLPSRGGDQTVSRTTEVETECNEIDGWFSTPDEARNDPNGIGTITKIKARLRSGVTHPPGAVAYMWLNHKVRENDLLTGLPLQRGDEIVNYFASRLNSNNFRGPTYIPNQYPDPAVGTNGDRVTLTGSKVRIIKTADKTAVAPGDDIEYTFDYSYTNDSGVAESNEVIIKDVLPEGLTYVLGSTTGAGEPTIGNCSDIDSSVTCDDNKNQVLIWNLGTIQANVARDNIVFHVLVNSYAPSGQQYNTVVIESPSDISPISQRQSEVGVTISIPSTLNIVKSSEDIGLREFTRTGQDIDYFVDLRNGKAGALTDLDIIDILPFKDNGSGIGDGTADSLNFNNITTQRNPGTEYHGDLDYISMELVEHPDSSAVCDVTANGGVKYYYTTVDPTTINLAPTVSPENAIGGPQNIWEEGTASAPPAGMSRDTITAVRAVGPSLNADAICRFKLKMHINNNLADDVYSNSAGASATGVTLPVLSNVEAVNIIGSDISNLVWIDENANGVQDAGENGLTGVRVELLDSNGNLVNNPADGQPYIVTTDANGEYKFKGLWHGDYQVRFTVPSGYFYSEANQGSDDVDSDVETVSGQTGTTDVFTLPINFDDTTRDAGAFQHVSINGTVWEDKNVDGIHDNGEPTLTDVEVQLLDQSGNPVDDPHNPGQAYKVRTNSNGEYSFVDLIPGNYIIKIGPVDDHLASPQDQGGDETKDSDIDSSSYETNLITLTSGLTENNVDGGFYPLASIGDKVWRDDERNGIQADWEPGLEGVTVELLDSGDNPVDELDNPGTPYKVTTDSNGNYLFEHLVPGDYKVKFTLTGDYNPTDKDQGGDEEKDSDMDPNTFTTDVISVLAGEKNMTIDAGFYALYANVFDPPSAIKTVSESGESEIEWKMVWINDGNMVAINTQILDDVPAGTIYVAGSVQCDARGTSVTNICTYDQSENRIRWEGDIAPDPGGTDEDDSLNEVVITYRTTVPQEMETVENQAQANWDANGDGDFNDDIARGQNPVVTDDTNLHENDPTVWTRVKKAEGNSSIGNTIWLDKNANGKQDEGEPGLENIRVKAIWYGPNNRYDHGKKDDVVYRTDTNHNGHYKFENLPKGKYRVIVKEEDVQNYIQTYDETGKLNNQATVRLSKHDNHTKADFGYTDREMRLAKTGGNYGMIMVLFAMSSVLYGVKFFGGNKYKGNQIKCRRF